MRNNKLLTVVHEIYRLLFWFCDTHKEISSLRCYRVWKCPMYFQNIQSVYLMRVGLCQSLWCFKSEELCMLCTNGDKPEVIIHRIQESSISNVWSVLLEAGFKCSQYAEIRFYKTFYKNNIFLKALRLEANLLNYNLECLFLL